MFKLRLFILILISSFCLQVTFAQQNSDNNWPSFRGHFASGLLDDANLPTHWNLDKNENIKWKTPIPGLAHSSPIVWDDYIFVTTAISSNKDEILRVGLFGDGGSAQDTTVHQFKVYCIDKNTGDIIWERLAHEGVPKSKRHTKASQANCTPATNGKHLLAFFASEGLFCYNFKGDLLWKKDFGVLQASPSDAVLDWGFSSSPFIYDGKVVIQCDFLQDAFLATLDIETGEEIWRTQRDEHSTWGSPNVLAVNGKPQIVVNGYKHIGAYDFETGKEIWWMKGGGDVPVPTPVFAHDLIFINSAHGRMSPIYAISPNAVGDITLSSDETSNEHIKWSIKRGGAYMQTSLVYGDYLYNLKGNGLLSCFKAKTGELMYKEPLKPGTGISASGVASDGKLFFSSELGDIFVVQAGPVYKLLAKNPLNDICMSTPAISKGAIYFRSQHYLIAVAKD